MSGLNANYVAALDLNPYFVDKSTGTPLSGGTISFYEDNNRTTAKPVYELVQGGAIPPNYSYEPFSNPIILSGVGTVVDKFDSLERQRVTALASLRNGQFESVEAVITHIEALLMDASSS